MKRYFLTFLLLLYFIATPKASATGLSLGVFPPIIQIQADPPSNFKTPITIQNLGEETANLDIILKPFTAKDSENGEINYLSTSPLIFQRMQIFEGDRAVKNITLAPSEQKKLNFHIGIPKDEPISDYYFSIVFIRSSLLPGGSQDSRDGGTSQTTGGVATNVLLSIGKGQAKGIIEEFSSPLFLEKGPVPFTVRVKNTGEHVIAPIGQILIKNFFGQTVGKVDLLPVNILAGTVRAIPDRSSSQEDRGQKTQDRLQKNGNNSNEQSPDSGFLSNPKSVFRPPSSVLMRAYWGESFLLGPYTATLTLALSDEGPVYKKNINFYGAPTQAIIGLIVAILIVISIVTRVRKRLG